MPTLPLTLLFTALLLAGCTRPVPTPSDSLAGTAWLAESIGGRGVMDRLQSTIQFDADGGVSGNAGCNQFSASYETAGAALSVGRLGMTKRMCAPAVMEQEAAFAQALERAERFTLSDEGFLFLHTADGTEVMRLVPHEVETGDG